MTTMPADTAAWIRDHVLTNTYRRGTSDPTTCDCQAGPCSYCQNGQHRQSQEQRQQQQRDGEAEKNTLGCRLPRISTRPSSSEKRLPRISRRPRISSICPCGCTPIGCEPPPVTPAARPEQLDLFAALPVGAVRP